MREALSAPKEKTGSLHTVLDAGKTSIILQKNTSWGFCLLWCCGVLASCEFKIHQKLTGTETGGMGPRAVPGHVCS